MAIYPRTNGSPGVPFYASRPTPQPTPGVENYAFLPAFGLPPQWIVGGGIVPMQSFAVTQEEQVYWTHDTIQAGLEGVVAGQMALQRLLDPRFGAYGGGG